MMKQENMLDKYYMGETSLDEEKALKARFINEENDSAEKDIFGYFQSESFVPGDLEASIFSKLTENHHKTKIRKIKFYTIGSAAAAIVIIFSIYLNFRANERVRIENNFFVMEQALFQISKSIQPVEQEEMIILWVDDDVEIIIN